METSYSTQVASRCTPMLSPSLAAATRRKNYKRRRGFATFLQFASRISPNPRSRPRCMEQQSTQARATQYAFTPEKVKLRLDLVREIQFITPFWTWMIAVRRGGILFQNTWFSRSFIWCLRHFHDFIIAKLENKRSSTLGNRKIVETITTIDGDHWMASRFTSYRVSNAAYSSCLHISAGNIIEHTSPSYCTWNLLAAPP